MEEKKVTKNDPIVAHDSNGPKKKKKLVLILIPALILVALAVAGIILFFVFRKESDISTDKIMERLSQKIDSITDVVNYSEANDPNGILGQDNQYTSKSSWEDRRIPDHSSDYAGTIEVFNNAKDAELREWKISRTEEKCKTLITAEKYGSSVSEGWVCNDYHMIRKNTVIIRLSTSFDEAQLSEYEAALGDIIDKFVIPDINTPSTDRINELRKQIEDSIEAAAGDYEELYQKKLNEIAATFDNTLDSILVSLDEEELDEAKETLAFFKDGTYYSSVVPGFEKKIKTIEDKIADNKKKAQEEAARAERERLAKKNRKLGAGKYTACTNIESGTYDAKAVSGSGNLFVTSDSFSHYVNELMSASGAYGWNKEYQNLILSCGDVLEVKGNLTIQLYAQE